MHFRASRRRFESDFAGGGGGIADVSGGGCGGGGDDDSVECVLHSAGRTFEDIPEEIRALSAAQVASYLDATAERGIKLARP